MVLNKTHILLILFFGLVVAGVVIKSNNKNNLNKKEEINYNNIKSDYSATRTIKQDDELITIDFSQCTQDRVRIDVGFGSTTIVIGGKKGSNCKVNYGGEIENPNWDGSLPVTCEIPVNIGKISFSKTNYGVNFSPI